MNVTTDPTNCGGCGHSCLGGACSAGLCLPEPLAVVPGIPAEIALDGDDVVIATGGGLTSSGGLYRVPAAGGDLEVLYRGLGAEPALAVTVGGLLVADSGQPRACWTSSSAGDILAITGGAASVYSAGRRCAHWLNPSDDGLTWVEEAPLRTLFTGDPGPWIARLPASAPPGAPPTRLYGPRQNGITNLVQRGSSLIWHESGSSTSAIVQMPVTGGSVMPIVSVPGSIGAFAVDAERLVYAWSASTTRVVVRSLATGQETIVAELKDPFFGPFASDWRIAFDSSFVYWIKADGLWAIDTRSFERRRLISGASELTQDDRFLYVLRVINHGDGQLEVVRIRKPAALGPAAPSSLACQAPLGECDSDPFSHLCFDLRTDPDHCGNCGVVCAAGEVCTGGRCACAPTSLMCGGRCVDPATDKNNCGRCGRSCGGGDCGLGDCTPIQIGEPTYAIVQDATALYYTKGNQVKRLDKQSTTTTTLAQLTSVRSLAIDASKLYVVDASSSFSSTIYSLAKDGSGLPTPLYPNQYNPRRLAVAGDVVLWDKYWNFGDTAQLVYAAADGSGIRGSFQSTGLYPGSNDDVSAGIAVAGSTVYWLLEGLLVTGTQPRGAIVRIDLAATPPTASLLTTLDHYPESLAVVGDRLYVTTGELLSVPTAGGPITVHLTGLGEVGDLVSTAEGDLFWVDGASSDWFVRHRAPSAVVPRAILSNTVTRDARLLVDGDRLYAADPFRGIFVMTR